MPYDCNYEALNMRAFFCVIGVCIIFLRLNYDRPYTRCIIFVSINLFLIHTLIKN